MPSKIDLRDILIHYGPVDESIINNRKKITLVGYERDHVLLEFFQIGSLAAYPIKIKYDTSLPSASGSGSGPVAKVRAMARNAALKLGHPIPRTHQVVCPSSVQEGFMYGLLLVLAITKFKPQWIRVLGSYKGLSAISNLLLNHGKQFFSVIYGIHVIEILFVMIPALIKYRVPYKNWPSWIIMNFIEGFYSLLRFNSLTDSDI
ncbi:uncharacterized protein KQ657_001909 [Scheffersomyces spartinae]|uniref:DUF2470 domain-containing protein n=1 Tax=Scheffersomyces spartinae TaxID=45513 RepID=A0A9P8AH05_9ASCO|nr:uncharacterized protein KQ657_001909 [Scheffersomyces spartinae]KAG7192193.1 hypothetical protein KQ657_001909 [Scheffersomyces spartinae]